VSDVRRSIDCAVHSAGAPLEQLVPYLSDYWAAYVRETFLGGASSGTGRLHVTAGASFTYPAWAESLSLKADEVSLEAIQSRVLSRSELAILHCYGGAEAFTHPYFAPALATAINRWLADEWLSRDDRLLASAVIAPQHTQSAVEEVERIAQDGRFVQIALPARSTEPYGNQRYWPIWEAAAAHGLALAISYGGASLTPPTPVHWPASFFELYVDAPLQHGTHLASLIFSGIFERFPDLKVVLVESGWTWLPQLMWRMDWEWKASRREVPWVRESPSDYVRKHIRVTTEPCDAPDDLKQLGQVIAQLESDEMLLYGSDHPRTHDVGVDDFLQLLSPEQGERLLWRNAADTYGLADRLGGVGTGGESEVRA
jgi:predicted TIM-barrel fold metal-dependent hydrolase